MRELLGDVFSGYLNFFYINDFTWITTIYNGPESQALIKWGTLY